MKKWFEKEWYWLQAAIAVCLTGCAFALSGCANTTTVTVRDYDASTHAVVKETVTETSENVSSAIIKTVSDNGKDKMRIAWIDCTNVEFGATYTSTTVGFNYFEFNGGYVDIPIKLDGQSALTLDGTFLNGLKGVIGATKLQLGVAGSATGDFSAGTGGAASATSSTSVNGATTSTTTANESTATAASASASATTESK